MYEVEVTYWQEQRAVYEAKEAAIRRKLEQGDLSETYREHFAEWLDKFPRAYELIDAKIEDTRAGRLVDSPLQYFDHPGVNNPFSPPLPSKASELSIANYLNEIYQEYYGQIQAMRILKKRGLLEEFKDLPEQFDQMVGLPLAPRPKLEEIQTELNNVSQIIFERLLNNKEAFINSSGKQKKSLFPTEQRKKYAQRLEPDTETIYEALSRAHRGIGKESEIGIWLLDTDRNHLSYASRNHKGYIALLVPVEGEAAAFLEALLKSGSLQAAKALNYIYGVLLGDGTNIPDTPKARISLDDIAENAWGSRRVTNKVQMERRAEVWKWLQMFRAMKIVGQRSGWNDFKTQEPAPCIHANILVVSDEEHDDLYGENPPRSVLVALLSEFAIMLGRKFGCYLEGAEKIKKISSGTPSGALANALYISLNSHWKRHKKLDASPSRQELLDRNDMEGKPFREYLYNRAETKEPDRALGYWEEAIKHLVKVGIIDSSSDEIENSKRRPEKVSGWRDTWYATKVDLQPAEFIRSQLTPIVEKEQAEKTKSAKRFTRKPVTKNVESDETGRL